MRRTLVRLFALVVLLGQLQWVPAAFSCVEEHRQPASHCDEAMTTDHGPALTPAPEVAPGLCALLGPCVLPSPMVTAARVSADIAAAPLHAAPALNVARPDSFEPSPTTPPPQA